MGTKALYLHRVPGPPGSQESSGQWCPDWVPHALPQQPEPEPGTHQATRSISVLTWRRRNWASPPDLPCPLISALCSPQCPPWWVLSGSSWWLGLLALWTLLWEETLASTTRTFLVRIQRLCPRPSPSGRPWCRRGDWETSGYLVCLFHSHFFCPGNKTYSIASIVSFPL